MHLNNRLLKDYISNLHVNLSMADYTKCWVNWSDIDYTPAYNKFYFICDGEGLIKIGNKEFYPQKGDLVLMPAGIKQSFSTINKNTYSKYWCHFTSTIGETNLFDIIMLPNVIHVTDIPRITAIFKKLINNYRSTEIISSFNIKALLFELISYYVESAVIKDIKVSDSKTIERLNSVIKYIEINLSKNIKNEDLAKIANYHPNHFIKFFKTHMGNSPMHYINKMRISKASNLLQHTDMSVTEIAENTGFCDLYYFSKVFKNDTGYSPTEFKQL